MPPLLTLANAPAYRQHFVQTYCRSVITTHDGMRVYFQHQDFDHAFFESSGRRGQNDVFSPVRAERMDWIAVALIDPNAVCYQGWNKRRKVYDPTRRVTVVIDDFVIVIGISQRRGGSLKANFITCFRADNSIGKIRQSPRWTMQECLNALR